MDDAVIFHETFQNTKFQITKFNDFISNDIVEKYRRRRFYFFIYLVGYTYGKTNYHYQPANGWTDEWGRDATNESQEWYRMWYRRETNPELLVTIRFPLR